MSSTDRSEPSTPVHRRLLRTNVPGVYKRGGRYVAITQHRGGRVKSYHRTKAEARVAKAERTAGARPTSRERFEDYAERWLVEYSGRTARGPAPSTRAAYALIFHFGDDWRVRLTVAERAAAPPVGHPHVIEISGPVPPQYPAPDD